MLVGFRAENHPQQTAARGPRDFVDERATPWDFFRYLDARFHFTVDVAALPRNAKCARFFTPDDNGLEQSWAGERVWCNPPFSDIGPWVAKAVNEWGSIESPECIVLLVPANRTEQRWWQTSVEPFRDGRSTGGPRVEFLAGRQRFIAYDRESVEANERPPFGICLLIWEDA